MPPLHPELREALPDWANVGPAILLCGRWSGTPSAALTSEGSDFCILDERAASSREGLCVILFTVPALALSALQTRALLLEELSSRSGRLVQI